ncbi:hypothetical protein C8R43DRAFT_1239378 [Mycena crocata]|nr:hypothetical protein C8R43DRAFT_1239378 [Mycena crocata]
MTDTQPVEQKETILNQLRTGYLPTPAEIGVIRVDLAALSKELGRLGEVIRDLSAQRDRSQDSIDLQKALISPVRRVPDDLVQDIFLACIPTDRNPGMSTIEAPLLLCRICSTWRALALATRRLWAALHIPIDFVLRSEQRLHAVNQWLERSAPHSLCLSVCGTVWGSAGALVPTAEVQNGLLDIILKSAPRWRDIKVIHPPPSYVDKLQDLATPLLQAIEIRAATRHIAKWWNFIGTSSVHSLYLNLEILPEDTARLLPLLSHITHLTISPLYEPIQGDVALSILHSLPHFISLHLLIRDLDSAPYRTTHLPYLESLTLRSPFQMGLSGSVLDDVLGHLSMPRLLHLAVATGETPDSNLPCFVLQFTVDALHHSLSNLPSLAKLRVRFFEAWGGPFLFPVVIVEDIFSLLSEAGETRLCPSLTALEIYGSHCITDDALFNFLQARVDFGGDFRFKIHFEDSDSILPDVKRFCSSGLHISLTKSSPWYPRHGYVNARTGLHHLVDEEWKEL